MGVPMRDRYADIGIRAIMPSSGLCRIRAYETPPMSHARDLTGFLSLKVGVMSVESRHNFPEKSG
jgi:hypothetical protein